MVTGAGGGGVVFTIKLDQASFQKYFSSIGQGGSGQGGATGSTINQQQAQSQRQSNFLRTLLEFEAIKGVIRQGVANSSIANTYLSTMGKIFGAAMDILLIPFLPVLNLIMIGITMLIKWFIESGTFAALVKGIGDLIVSGAELIGWVRSIPDKFKDGVLAGLKSIAGDLGTAIGNVIKNMFPHPDKDKIDIGPFHIPTPTGGVSGAGWGEDLKHFGLAYAATRLVLPALPIVGGPLANGMDKATGWALRGAARGAWGLTKFGAGGAGRGLSGLWNMIRGGGGAAGDIAGSAAEAVPEFPEWMPPGGAGAITPPGIFSPEYFQAIRRRDWGGAFGASLGYNTSGGSSQSIQNSGNQISIYQTITSNADPKHLANDFVNFLKGSLGYSLSTGGYSGGAP